MKKRQIGIFEFDKPLKSSRDGRKNYDFRNLPYTGLRRIVSEIDRRENEVSMASAETFFQFDFVLISMISFWDYLNIWRAIPDHEIGRPFVLVGGPACQNIRSIIPKIDGAVFGRCDNGLINDLLNGGSHPSFWIKKTDGDFTGEYAVNPATTESFRSPQGELFGDREFIENSVGCRKKCTFCAYSWWNKYVSVQRGGSYSSGYSDYEDFFQSLDWAKCIRGGVTGLDGCTESTRRRVKKNIAYSDLVETLLRSNAITQDVKNLRLKCYSIYGYPWETPDCINDLDLIPACREVDHRLNNSVIIRMHFGHFIPYQKTPMWFEPFNFGDFRQPTVDRPVLYNGSKIKLYSGGMTNQGISASAITTGLQRIRNEHGTDFIDVVSRSKFLNLKSSEKTKIFRQRFDSLFSQQDKESIPNIKTPYSARIAVSRETNPS